MRFVFKRSWLPRVLLLGGLSFGIIIEHRNTFLYRHFPFGPLSRTWGSLTELTLPIWIREPLYKSYSKIFSVQLHEIENQNLKDYPNLSSFFSRKLKENARPVNQNSSLVFPCDGRILYHGYYKGSQTFLPLIKGISYSLRDFLGLEVPSENLYQIIIYLGPGDYHGFSSPVTWKIRQRKHFSGRLLSVNPSIVNWIGSSVLTMNERVVYSGDWTEGFFSLTAVGATAVGSISVLFDSDLSTNSGQHEVSEVFWKDLSLHKGQNFGEFKLGSTIVLIFESKKLKDSDFSLKNGQFVKMGESILKE